MDDDGARPDIDKIRRLAVLMERRGLSRVVLTEGGVTVRLEAGATTRSAPPAEMPAEVVRPPEYPPAETREPERAPPGVPLLSPTTGTFYRAPAPGEPPFVDVDDFVEVGQTVGIIMAMKVMSEVPAEIAGQVTSIPAQDGELVQTGSPLIVVDPL